MESKRFELECQVCGTTMSSSNAKEQCQVCGGEMIEAPFFSVQQSMSLDQKDNTGRINTFALIVMLLIGVLAAGVIIFTRSVQDKKAPAEKKLK